MYPALMQRALRRGALCALVAAGLPAPLQQYRVRLNGRTFRIDLAYPERRVAIELDGWDCHRTRSAFDADRARADALVVDGWTLLRFTSRSSDAEIVGCVAAALEQNGRFGAA